MIERTDIPEGISPETGLTEEQVRSRTAAGSPRSGGRSEKEILFSNLFTFFNLVFVVLGLLLVVAGSSVKNMTFLVVAACNACIGIIQEIRAKRAVDALTLVAQKPVWVIREGEKREIPPEQLVRDDILLLAPGDVLPADGIVRAGKLQMNEALLTGEADAVFKAAGDDVLSGSVVLSGHGRVQLTAVGAESFAVRLAAEAKANPKAAKSEMMRALDRLIRVVGLALVPVGVLLFHQEYVTLAQPFRESMEGTVAALVGMIPEGLYLLTSIAMAASALKLSRKRVLVQDLNCIESLARVDVLCVDKTGTITEPDVQVEAVIPLNGIPMGRVEDILAALFAGEEPDNDTARAMAARFGRKTDWNCKSRIPFSPEYKWSGGIFTDHGAFLAGAPEAILKNPEEELRQEIRRHVSQGSRVLLVAAYDGIPAPGQLEAEKATPLALCLLSSPIRENAREIFSYFEEQGVSVRVISGDNAETAAHVALRAGITGAEKYIDMSGMTTREDYLHAAAHYNVFGRVTPEQKKQLIAALQSHGHTVAMTGDGVNDLLAMKQADCSVAMASGAQAASRVASLVLLDSDFAAMPGIVAEGRRVINNIQRAATLFLVKNIFSLVLSLISLLTNQPYPFEPIHLTLIGSLTIGIPAFFLAMEPNYGRIHGKFLRNVLGQALPGGLTNVVMVLLVQLLSRRLSLSPEETGTLCAAMLAAVGLGVLLRTCRPFGVFRVLIWCAMAGAMVVCFTTMGGWFELDPGIFRERPGLLLLLAAAPVVLWLVNRVFGKHLRKAETEPVFQ